MLHWRYQLIQSWRSLYIHISLRIHNQRLWTSVGQQEFNMSLALNITAALLAIRHSDRCPLLRPGLLIGPRGASEVQNALQMINVSDLWPPAKRRGTCIEFRSCLSVCLSEYNFRKPWHRKYIFARPIYLQWIRVKFVYEVEVCIIREFPWVP